MNTQLFSRRAVRASVALFCALGGELAAQGQTVVMRHSFDSAAGGGTLPYGGLTLGSDGNLYGTTNTGGAGHGTAYRIDTAGVYTPLHSFVTAEGLNPYGGLVEVGGAFYGTAYAGGAHAFGTVFVMQPNGDTSTLYDFGSSDGQNPKARLLLADDGNLYGTTEHSGITNTLSTVFQITTGGSESVIHGFTTAEGAHNEGALIQGPDHNLYGTVEDYGTYSHGAVFSMTTAGGNFTDLHFFHDTDGQDPADALFQAANGYFYGTTVDGGTAVSGTVFRMDSMGNVATLHSFASTPDGATPYSGLVQTDDGTLYGTTTQGGTGFSGTIFKIDANDDVTTIYNFAGGPNDGSHPVGTMVLDRDGNLWGTTLYGGSTGFGTIFEVFVANEIFKATFETGP